MYKFGLYKSPLSKQDYVLNLTKEDLPKQFSIRHKMTNVRSQGNEGSCVGFATACGVMEFQNNMLDYPEYNHLIRLSPRFLYEEAKLISGHSEGTTLKAAMMVGKKMGTSLEDYWPYKPKEVGAPKNGAIEDAKRFKIKSYARIKNLKDLKKAIHNPRIGAVLIGVKVYKGMISEEAKKTGVCPDPSCLEKFKVLGGHALCACGWNDFSPHYEDGHILCKGSWGEKYGDKGYHYLSYKYINSNMLDAFSCIDIDDPLPYVRPVYSIPKGRDLWL